MAPAYLRLEDKMLPKLYIHLFLLSLYSFIVLLAQTTTQRPILNPSSSLSHYRSPIWADKPAAKREETLGNEASDWGGLCGNSKYDNKSIGIADKRVPINFRKAILPEPGISRIDVNRQKIMRQQLEKDLVVIRLNIIYDSSMANQFPDGKLERFVRNLIFETQLYYEQPEMFRSIRILLVVVSMEKSAIDYEFHLTSNQILERFSIGPDMNPNADLNLLLIFRNIWDYPPTPEQGRRKILGLAYVGTFCQKFRVNALILNAASLGQSVVLAHELAHSLNAAHDGEPTGRVESQCPAGSTIMSPSSGSDKLKWSRCTITVLTAYLVNPLIFKCVFDKDRIDSAIPINLSFDFRPSPSRLPLPGDSSPINEQCKEAIGAPATSSLSKIGSNGDGSWETCQNLDCAVGGKTPVAYVGIGPAPSGSDCIARGSRAPGRCYYARCLAKQ